jgi:hypothetical protein
LKGAVQLLFVVNLGLFRLYLFILSNFCLFWISLIIYPYFYSFSILIHKLEEVSNVFEKSICMCLFLIDLDLMSVNCGKAYTILKPFSLTSLSIRSWLKVYKKFEYIIKNFHKILTRFCTKSLLRLFRSELGLSLSSY